MEIHLDHLNKITAEQAFGQNRFFTQGRKKNSLESWTYYLLQSYYDIIVCYIILYYYDMFSDQILILCICLWLKAKFIFFLLEQQSVKAVRFQLNLIHKSCCQFVTACKFHTFCFRHAACYTRVNDKSSLKSIKRRCQILCNIILPQRCCFMSK